MKVTLDVPSGNMDFFLELIRSLNFEVKIQTSNDLPVWHQDILEERLAKYENWDKSQFTAWSDLQKQLITEGQSVAFFSRPKQMMI